MTTARGKGALRLVPVTMREANAFVARPRVDEHPTQSKLRWEKAA